MLLLPRGESSVGFQSVVVTGMGSSVLHLSEVLGALESVGKQACEGWHCSGRGRACGTGRCRRHSLR